MLRTAFPLALLLLAPWLVAPLAAAEPSFAARADRAPAARRRFRCLGGSRGAAPRARCLPAQPRAGDLLAGLWKNHDSELFLAADVREGRYRATFGATTFGWAKYHCHFTAAFAPADKGFAAAAPRNTDPEVDEDAATRLVLVRSGAMLDLTEEIQDNAAEAKLSRVCPRAGDFTDPLFHTSLKPADARRLKPED
jgi:hypothetical protein